MKVDIEIVFGRVQVLGTAKTLTLLNKSVIDPGSQQELMVLSNVTGFLVKNSTVNSTSDQAELVNKASKRYEELWKQGFYKLQSKEIDFTPDDWEVSRVEVNAQASVYPAGTHPFPPDITVLVENK